MDDLGTRRLQVRMASHPRNRRGDPDLSTSEPALLRPDFACAWLGCSRSTLYRLVREHRLVAVRPFGRGELRFRVDDLRAFVANLDPSDRDGEGKAGV
jgi:excisionase family DNA binding protein